MYLNSLKKEECTGCTACQQICSHNAISMKSDEEGFLYPIKDLSLCTNCGLCEKICPVFLDEQLNDTPDVFAAMLKEVEQRQRSSSGGVFYAIAKYVLDNHGVVYGASFDKEMNLRMSKAESLADLEQLRGSKYVQANLNNTYREIKCYLKENRLVYFSGTPCQIAGLKAFLCRDNSNLLTSDLVCHGVPSQMLFHKHLDYLKKKNRAFCINTYNFRNNAGWGVFETYSYIDKNYINRKSNTTSYMLSPYLYSFIEGITYRYSCYTCPFAKIPRQGDVTLADFWGINNYIFNIDVSKGCSLVLVNTNKGKHLWSIIKNSLDYYPSNIKDAAKYNPNLIRHSILPNIRKDIYKMINDRGYDYVAENIFVPPHKNMLIIKIFIKRLIGKKLSQKLGVIYKYFK